jgi:hypothetical protein
LKLAVAAQWLSSCAHSWQLTGVADQNDRTLKLQRPIESREVPEMNFSDQMRPVTTDRMKGLDG